MQSMTGFGRSNVQDDDRHLTVEARSVNHRYLDIALRYPRPYASLEARMKQLVGHYVARGRIDLKIVEQKHSGGAWSLTLNHALAEQYYRALLALQDHLRAPGTIDLSTIINLREVLSVEEADEDAEAAWELIAKGMHEALQALKAMRCQEGAFLRDDLQSRLHVIVGHVQTIRQRVPHVVTDYQQRLAQRVSDLFDQFSLDPDRLHQEIILYAERADVAEELTRLEAHIQAFSTLLNATDTVGRKIEFLVQEMNREINTIASKSNDAEISQRVVDVKSELERIREQIQNVE